MQINIEILSISKNKFPKYEQLDIAYRDLSQGGKVAGKKLMSFVYPEVFKQFDGAQQGVKFDIDMKKEPGKDGKEYWQWVEAKPSTASNASSTTSESPSGRSLSTPKSTYETPEERKARQELIVRQSSITAALTFFELTKNTKVSSNSVLTQAKEFRDWVYGESALFDINHPFENMEDDIPL